MHSFSSIHRVLAFLVGLCISCILFAQIPFLEESSGFSLEGGLLADMILTEGSVDVRFHPDFTFYFGNVSPAGRPTREAAFLDRVGSASFVANIFADGAERNSQNSSGSLDNTMLGFDAKLHWVWNVLPFSLAIPLEDTRIRWRYAEDDTAAVLSYHMLAIEPGFYVLPNVEVAAGIGYLLPDLFFKTTGGTNIYEYWAWDIRILNARVKTVFEPVNGMWISAEARMYI